MSFLDKTGLTKLWAKIKATFATKAEIEGKLDKTGGTVNGDLKVTNDFYVKDSLFGESDEGNPIIANATGSRTIAIGNDGVFDGNYMNYTFPEKSGVVALLDDIPEVKSKQIITTYSTVTTIGAFQTAGTAVVKRLTLTTPVQAGDRVKLYLRGSSTMPPVQGGIIEFETYVSNSQIVGTGCTFSGSANGASCGIIGAEISTSATTSSSLVITLWPLTTTQYAAASTVYLEKVEIIR